MKSIALAMFVWPMVLMAARCDPPEQLAAVLQRLPTGTYERHLALEDLAKAHPDDFWLNRLFVDSSVYEYRATRERYQKQFEAHPGSIDDEYLYGRSLVGFDTKEALRIYADILSKDPDNPWVHNSQLEIHKSQAFRDRAKLERSFEAVTRVCPAWLAPYDYVTALDDRKIAPYAARLRTMMEATTDPPELRLYSTLWSAESRLNLDGEKQRIAADVKRLQEMNAPHATIAEGAKLIGDITLQRAMTPPRPPDIGSEANAWLRSHPNPGPKDRDTEQAHGQELLTASDKWISEDPESLLGYYYRVFALLDIDPKDMRLAKAVADASRVARTDRHSAGYSFMVTLARQAIERGARLDWIPAVLDQSLTQIDDPEGVFHVDLDPSGAEIVEMNRMQRVREHVSAVIAMSMYYEKIGQAEKSRAVLDPLPGYLGSKTIPAGTKNVNSGHNLLLFREQAESDYWQRLAELDEREGKQEEALKDYRGAAAALWYSQRNVLPKARRLWKDLGRTDEAWQAWLDSIPKSPSSIPVNNPGEVRFAPVNRALPKIVLKDLAGNEWPPDRFTGKITIATVWATWCAPCIQELPLVVKLAERLKGRADVQVVSFNTDENPETVRRFIERSSYQFPVLIAKNFAEDLMPYLAIPRTWIIRDGAIVQEAEGFDANGDAWIERVIATAKLQ